MQFECMQVMQEPCSCPWRIQAPSTSWSCSHRSWRSRTPWGEENPPDILCHIFHVSQFSYDTHNANRDPAFVIGLRHHHRRVVAPAASVGLPGDRLRQVAASGVAEGGVAAVQGLGPCGVESKQRSNCAMVALQPRFQSSSLCPWAIILLRTLAARYS